MNYRKPVRSARTQSINSQVRAGSSRACGYTTLIGRGGRSKRSSNGHVVDIDDAGFLLHADQSFGNCPKYFQAREPTFVAGGTRTPHDVHRTVSLDDRARALVAAADTFFIATSHPLARASDSPARGVDVSHRGGRLGFVQVQGDVLNVPDYLGNFYFNTFGNLLAEPRCGLLFIDFDTGCTLQLAARGEIVTGAAELAAFPGAQRLLRLHVTGVLRAEAVLPLLGPSGDVPRAALKGAVKRVAIIRA